MSRPPEPPAPDATGGTTVEPAALLALAAGVAARAGALLLEGMREVRTEVSSKSTGTDMVTEMDRASEQLIVEGIVAARPGDGILGEEGTDRPGGSGVRWVIDPLDGTTNYLYGLPGFAVSVAAEVDGAVVAGAVFDPVHDELFTATLGGGARRNGEPIACSTEDRLGHALLATGFSYTPSERTAQAAAVARVIASVRDIRRHGAAAVDLCWLACGRFDAYFERGLAPWDLAAGDLVAREAGALTGDLTGGPVRSPGAVLGAPPALFEPLRTLLVDAGA
jgi:myo-inositol-1(or 4)-monophosphatase